MQNSSPPVTVPTSPAVPTAPVLSPEVADALAAGRPVVALESTLLAHGLPRPQNRAAADQVEDAVRAGGAVPATIAVLDGVPHVGLTAEQVDRVCADPELAKLGIRDLPIAAALGRSGATTVSSTALLAERAGIGVFATGGLGGVHRHASDTFDESADLTALSRTSLVVVCAGVKSILDVPATLERLESLSVTVVAPLRPSARATGRSRTASLSRSGSAHTRSTCPEVRPTCGTPSRTAIVAGTAPPARTASSTWSAAVRFSGRGRPCASSVLSSATTGRPAASASATSGERTAVVGTAGEVGTVAGGEEFCTLSSWWAVRGRPVTGPAPRTREQT